MHFRVLFRSRVTTTCLAWVLGLFSGSAVAAENWQSLPPTRGAPAITDQIESHPDLTYARYGERELKLDLYRPKGAKEPLPAIVCIHGGGWQTGERRNHAHIAQALAARGYVTVTISYRLSGEAKFPAQIQDAKATVRWLRANAQKWGVDPKAIGATGLSAGGHLAALLATSGGVEALEGDGGNREFSSTIQAAAPMGAQSDFMSERNREISKSTEIWQKFLGGSQEDVPQTYQLASPRYHLDANDAPACFISDEFDDASTHADEMRRDCMALGIPTGLLVIPGAPHPFLTKQKFFDIAIDQIDSFFSLHLKRKGTPEVKASGTVPAVVGDWKHLGGGYGGCEGPEWITVEKEPTLIYAAHHDRFVFRWSLANGLSGVDWLPTLCAIAGAKINTADFDGEDTSAAWLGKGPHVRTKPLFWKSSSPGSESFIREVQWKLRHPSRKNGGELELYDIIADPAESRNVAAQHPDIVKQLSAKAEAWVATLPKEYLKTKDKQD